MAREVRQVSFAGGEIAPALQARTDLAKYFTSLKTCRNFLVTQHGVLMNRSGTRFVHEVKDSTRPVRLVPFIFSADQTFVLEFGSGYIRFYHDGLIVTGPATTALDGTTREFFAGQPMELATPYVDTDLNKYKFVQMGDVITIVHPLYAPRELKRHSNTNWTLDRIVISRPDGPSLAGFSFVLDPKDRQYNPNQGWSGVFQGGEVCHANGPSGNPPEHTWRSLIDGNAGLLPKDEQWAWHDEGTDPPGINHLTTPGRPAKAWKWVITAIHPGGAESLPSAEIDALTYDPSTTNPSKSEYISLHTDRPITLQWPEVPGAEYYNVYRGHNGLYGYIGEAVAVNGVARFTDDAQPPDYSTTPPTERNPFAEAGDYPSVIAYYQQRRWVGGTVNRPQTIWGSKVGDYYNFDRSQTIPKADDSVEFTLASRQLETITNLLGLRTLLLLTTSGEWSASGGQGGPITPSNVEIQPHGYRGSTSLDPIAVGNVALFVQALGNVVRELIYDYSSDSYTGNDLTVLATHLFQGHKIVDWAFAPAPYSILWAVRDDGVLLGCTYLREHELTAWHRHDMYDDPIERVCVVPEGVEHAVYVVVKRGNKRYVERFTTRAQIPRDANDKLDTMRGVFLDSSLSYEGSPATVFVGLDHLEFREVMVLADGNVCGPYTVQRGQIDISDVVPDGASIVHVGLSYVSVAETLDLASQQADLRAASKNVFVADVEVTETRGLKVGVTGGEMKEWRQRSVKDSWGHVAPYDGFVEVRVPSAYSRDARLILRQEDPLPVTITGIGRRADVA